MRKLLLTTTALITAATLSSASYADMGNLSITGGMEFTYEDQDSAITASGAGASGASGDDFSSDQYLYFRYENKTDSGLTIGMVQDIRSIGEEAATTAISDENFIYIKGGFGELQLGNKEGAGDKMTVTAADLMGPDSLSDNGAGMNGGTQSTTINLMNDNASLANSIADQNNITYYLPSMGGISIGASYMDAGQSASQNADVTTLGAKYDFESGAVNGSIHYGNSTKGGATSGDSSLNADSMGIKISSGPFTAIAARASTDYSGAITTTVSDYGASYDLGNGITLAAAGTQIDENTGGETSDITSVSVKYNIASGLDAYLTYHDYDYEDGTTGTTADDDGSKTLLTLKASF